MSTTTWISKEEERVAELIGKLERQLYELRQTYELDVAWLKAENKALADALRVRIAKYCYERNQYLDDYEDHTFGCRHYETERKLTEQDTP